MTTVSRPSSSSLWYESGKGGRADAARKQCCLADREVDAYGIRRKLEKPRMATDPARVLMMAEVPALDVADRHAVERHDERPCRTAAFNHVADMVERLVGLAPPFLHMRSVKPLPEQGIVIRCHRQEADPFCLTRYQDFRSRWRDWCKRICRLRSA